MDDIRERLLIARIQMEEAYLEADKAKLLNCLGRSQRDVDNAAFHKQACAAFEASIAFRTQEIREMKSEVNRLVAERRVATLHLVGD